jgi:hypothetical protein
MKKYEFEAKIIKHPTLNSGYVEFPFDTEKEFGKKGQLKVKAWFDEHLYRGSLVKMGHSCHCIGITKQISEQIGKNQGDIIKVVIEIDTEERKVELPFELKEFFSKNADVEVKFMKLSFTNKKEMVMLMNTAKKEETRVKRMQQIIDKLTKET